MAADRPVAYVTDVEGRWDKLVDFARLNPLVSLDGDRLRVVDGALFVFGGDAIDRGPAGQRVMATLLDAKRREPDRVVLLAGNRDINKLRLWRELQGHPPERAREGAPDATGPRLLRFIFERTMGAKDAFEHRGAELAARGARADDDAVVASYVDEVNPSSGALTAYLSAACLAHREGPTLFVHGAVTPRNLGVVPGRGQRTSAPSGEVDAWVDALNAFYAESMRAFVEQRFDATGEPAWAPLVAYQAPLRGTRENPESVVYGRPCDPDGNPVLPPRAIVERLAASGVRRVVVGHTPAGDCPAIVRDQGFEMIAADTSYAQLETGASVLVEGNRTEVRGRTLVEETAEDVHYAGHIDEAPPIGWSTEDGALVKSRLARGDYLLFKALPGYRSETTAVDAATLRRSNLRRARGA
ncbi:MAG: metallophosphoesterase [Polyangiaceae bacterium]